MIIASPGLTARWGANMLNVFFEQTQSIMKRYLILAAVAVLVLGACSKNDVRNDGTPISFGTYVGLSKATVGPISIDSLKKSADGFGVYCYYTDNGNYVQGTSTPNFMLNQKVYNSNYASHSNGAAATWTYSPIKYWPNEYGTGANSDNTDKLTFRAYAPYSTGSTNSISNLPGESTATTTLTYTVSNSDPVDLLWASNAVSNLTNLTKQTTTGTVNFTFSHALSKISFSHQAVVDAVDPTTSALDAATTITLNSVTIDGSTLYKSGVFDFAAGTWASQVAGTASTDDISLTSLNANVTETLTDLPESFFVIPCTSRSIKITVNYDVTTTDAAYSAGSVTTNNTIYKTATFTMAPGTAYQIKLLLGLTSVKINVNEILDWGAGSATEIDLPENTTA